MEIYKVDFRCLGLGKAAPCCASITPRPVLATFFSVDNIGMPSKQSIAFCFTLNNYSDDDLAAIIVNEEEYDYICIGFEVGKKGTPHLQGYIRFDLKVTFKQGVQDIADIFGHNRCHVEIAKGSPKQAIEYCKKDGDYFENGNAPRQGSAQWDAIEEAMKDPKTNPHLYNQYKKTYDAVKREEASKNKTRKLRMISEDDKFDIANATEGEILMITEPDDINTYNLEKTIFVNEFVSFHNILKCWYGGYPKKIRRGYELIPFNPEVIYLCYEGEIGKSNIEKKYLPMLDGDWQENYTETHI